MTYLNHLTMGKSASGGASAPISGEVGGLIFYISGEHQLTRTKGQTGKNAKSLEVQSNRRGFGNMQLWLNPLKEVLEHGFKNNIPHTGTFAHAISFMSKNARTGKGKDAVIHPEKFRISIGTLPMPGSISAQLDGQELVFGWDPSLSGSQTNLYDQVLLSAYEVEQKFAVCLDRGLFRKDGGARMPLPKAGTYHCYLGMVASDLSRQGDGVYLGEFRIT